MTTRIIGDAALRRKLNSLSDLRFLRNTMTKVGEHVITNLRKYPDGNQHRPQPFKTAKSRRYFFWALRNRMIEVPYRRGQSPGSEDIIHSWTQKARNTSVKIGSDASYGNLVQGPKQTEYHRTTGWKTTDKVIDEEEEKILKAIQKAVDRELSKG